MRWLTLVAIGVIICIFGTVFHLQGQAVVGPKSSFMYANPQWENYGIQMVIVGIIITIVGSGINIIKKESNKKI